MKVYATGLESSGNNWVRSVLKQHPDLQVDGDSFPTNYPEGTKTRHYPVPPSDFDVLVVTVRDQNCSEASIKRREYNKGRENDFDFNKNVEAICAYISYSNRKVFVSYETALIYKQLYWDNIFRQIGVPPVRVKTEYRNENSKYYGSCI